MRRGPISLSQGANCHAMNPAGSYAHAHYGVTAWIALKAQPGSMLKTQREYVRQPHTLAAHFIRGFAGHALLTRVKHGHVQPSAVLMRMKCPPAPSLLAAALLDVPLLLKSARPAVTAQMAQWEGF